jgi:hypothetical protein
MARSKLIWFWVFPLVAALCLIGVLLNPSIVFYSETSCFACIYIVVEAIILAVVLRILRKTDMLISWKAALYFAVVAGGSIALNYYLSPIKMETFFSFSLSVFMLFVFLNLGLLGIILAAGFWRACLISIIAGLINALMVIVTISAH